MQFDHHRKVVTSLAESIDKANAQKVKELVRLLVERVPMTATAVDPERIEWTPTARPFVAGLVGAPPEGFEPPTPALGRRRSIH